MNPRMYVGRFTEIAHLDKTRQRALLEQARQEAFVNQGLAGKAASHVLLCMTLAFAIIIIPEFLFSLSSAAQLMLLVIGIGVSGGIYQHLYRQLLARGLAVVLQKHEDNSGNS